MKFSFSVFWFWPLFLLLLGPFIYALGFCFPRGDDFDEACRAMFLFDLPGGLYEIGREWLTWSGRYTYHFLAVFLGKLPHQRWLAAIFGLGLFAVYFFACRAIGTACGLRLRSGCLFGLSVLFVILCCWQTLEDFYLFTDMLTICLQGAASLFFFAALARLWQAEGGGHEKKFWRMALIAGIFAIGVYEHAALAVMDALCVALALAFWKRKPLKRLARLFFWLAGLCLFSFFAPGNFTRQAARGKSGGDIFGEFMAAIGNFFGSAWVFPAILCGLLLACLVAQSRPDASARRDMAKALEPQRKICHALVFLLPLSALALILGYAALHSQSEYGLGDVPKFIASLSLYLSCALAGVVFAAVLPGLQKFPALGSRAAAFVLVLLLGLAGIGGKNFQHTFENAANGQILLLGNFMERRLAWLRELAGSAATEDKRPKFGLAGELARPDARKPPLDPALPHAVVSEFAGNAFPVWTREDLQPSGEVWPNKWAAWLYGLHSVVPARAAFNPEEAAAKNAIELAVPEELRKQGLVRAKKIVEKGQNETFNTLWLVLEFDRDVPETIALVRPNPLSSWRLLPLSLQKGFLDNLLAKNETGLDWLTRLTSGTLYYKSGNWLSENLLALPVFTGLDGEHFPDAVFLNAGDGKYYCLKPWM